jgi:hypothetical protein
MSSSAGLATPPSAGDQAPNTVDIKSFIDGRPISSYQWFLVAMCFLVVVADGMDVAIMGFVTPSILQEWDISRPAFGIDAPMSVKRLLRQPAWACGESRRSRVRHSA